MIRALPLAIGLLGVASSASAELTDAEVGTIRCAATALVLHTAVDTFVEAGADFSEDFVGLIRTAATDLLVDAQPLFAEGDDGNAEMGETIDRLIAEQDVAIADGEVAAWMEDATGEVRVCHMALLQTREAAE